MTGEEATMLDHSDDPSVERELDGNALAGLFESLFGSDVTAVPGRCAHCHTVNMVGAMRVYMGGPGAILRCPACDEVVIRIVETGQGTYLDARGAAYLIFMRPSPG